MEDGLTLFIYFMLSLLISGAGALPPGLINLAIADRTIKRGFRSGLVMLAGAACTEFFYTFIPLFFIDRLSRNPHIEYALQIAVTGIFLILAAVYYFKKTDVILPTTKVSSKRRDFGYGILMAGMNLLIIPFWVFISIWLGSNGFPIDTWGQILTCALGSTAGACLVFVLYARLGKFIVKRSDEITKSINQIIAGLFLLLGLFQLGRLLFYAR